MKQRINILVIVLAGVLATTLGCTSTKSQDAASTNKHESAGEYIDDSVITTKIKTAVLKEPTLKSYEITVETYKGVVQLSGFVSSAAEISKAGEIARAVKGVTSVKNDLRIKPK